MSRADESLSAFNLTPYGHFYFDFLFPGGFNLDLLHDVLSSPFSGSDYAMNRVGTR